MIKTKQGKIIRPGLTNGIWINDTFLSNSEIDMILNNQLDLFMEVRK